MFSVVVPAWNAARTLRQCVECVLEQTFREFELIIVDDGSTDHGMSVLQDISDNRLRIIRREQGGAWAARNTGLAAAAGDWIAFLDADDIWLPCHLEELDRIRSKFPEAGLIGTRSVYRRQEDWRDVRADEAGSIALIPYFERCSVGHRPLFISSSAVSRRAYASLGGFGPFGLGEDSEFHARVALHFPVAASTRTTAIWIVGSGGVTDSSINRWKDAPLRSAAEISPAVALLMDYRRVHHGTAAPQGWAAYIDAYVGTCLRTSASIADVKTIRKLLRLYTGAPPLSDLPYLALGFLPRPAARWIFAAARQMGRLARSMRTSHPANAPAASIRDKLRLD